MRAVVLTTEEEGIALAAGAWLGGQRAVLLMQSSGVGNCINMLSLPVNCRMPFLTLVTMRGEWAEFNPWQVPMGAATPAVLTAAGVHVRRADRPDDAAEIVAASAALAFDSAVPVAVLLSQRLIGAKDFAKVSERRHAEPARGRRDPAARPGRDAGRHRPRRADLRRRRRRRPGAELLPLGRDGRSGDARASAWRWRSRPAACWC